MDDRPDSTNPGPAQVPFPRLLAMGGAARSAREVAQRRVMDTFSRALFACSGGSVIESWSVELDEDARSMFAIEVPAVDSRPKINGLRALCNVVLSAFRPVWSMVRLRCKCMKTRENFGSCWGFLFNRMSPRVFKLNSSPKQWRHVDPKGDGAWCMSSGCGAHKSGQFVFDVSISQIYFRSIR